MLPDFLRVELPELVEAAILERFFLLVVTIRLGRWCYICISIIVIIIISIIVIIIISIIMLTVARVRLRSLAFAGVRLRLLPTLCGLDSCLAVLLTFFLVCLAIAVELGPYE